MPQQTRNISLMSRFILAGPCLIALLTACGGVPAEEGTFEDAPLATVSSDSAALGACMGTYQATHECPSSCVPYTKTDIRCWDGKPVWECKSTTYEAYLGAVGYQYYWSYVRLGESLASQYWCSTTAPNLCPAFCG
jgi:hypothetical protein